MVCAPATLGVSAILLGEIVELSASTSIKKGHGEVEWQSLAELSDQENGAVSFDIQQ